ncbi:uncharacterized protein LOC129780602 [Toxorhynchites rutilus septentrionalis]|uniref:uncharacterized protein LOC129780602 n=1 Tax=Toxorhynchites rutilus septentrionalis TaxID=329112 RepID=UPI00247A9E4B|nr:uncharacterized protein LOC129780602 [Toxorhynchites rutilus septentrionalis]
MTKKLKPKLHARDNIIDFLVRTDHFLKQYDPANHALQVEARLDKLDEKWDEFGAVQTQIEEMEELEEERTDQHKRTRAEFEELYFQVRAGLKSKLPTIPISPSTSNDTPPRMGTCASIQLPKINLPEFNGEFDKWLPFFDTFKTLIHGNPDLSAIQRFHYLRASLKGEALKVVDAFPMSEASYGAAWSALTKRFSNVYLQKKRHVNALLQYPKLKKITASGIHDVIDCFDRHLKILDQLGEVTAGWGAMLTQLVISKLDDVSQKDWEEFALMKEEPAYLHVMEFLEGQTRILDAIAVDQCFESKQVSLSSPTPPAKKPFSKLSVHSVSENSLPKCVSCSGSHYISNCPDFLKMTLDKRFQVVNSKKLCSNCLRRDHYNRDCSSNFRCRTCSKKHHTLLHPGLSTSGSGSAADTQFPKKTQTAGSGALMNTAVKTETTQQSLQSSVATIYAANVAAESREVHVFLSTVLVFVKDYNGRLHTARALLDSGSQTNLISERLCQMLKLHRKAKNIPISGIGSARIQINGSVSTTIGSRITNQCRWIFW